MSGFTGASPKLPRKFNSKISKAIQAALHEHKREEKKRAKQLQQQQRKGPVIEEVKVEQDDALQVLADPTEFDWQLDPVPGVLND